MAISSTSNSNASTHAASRSAAPWALLLALLLVIAWEACLRLRHQRDWVAYPQLALNDDQTVAYKAVREYISLDGPADVALVGSSQMREVVTLPAFSESLARQVGHPVTVANYSTRGARADAMQSIVQWILEQEKKPKVVVIGMSVRDLRTNDLDLPRMAVFWSPGDWWREFRKVGWSATSVLPVVVRNEAGKWSHTVRFREQLAIDLAKPFEYVGVRHANEGNPITGELTLGHEGNRGLKRLDQWRIPFRRMLGRIRASYGWAEGPKSSPVMTNRLRTMIAQLRAEKVNVVIVEMPVASMLRKELERVKMIAHFERAVTKEISVNPSKKQTSNAVMRFIPTSQQSFVPTEEHFVDLQHLNRPGATLFGDWLAGEIAPLVK